MRKVLSVVLCLMMVLSLATPAFAANTINGNYDEVIRHIEAVGIYDEDMGVKYVGDYLEQDGMMMVSTMFYHTEGLVIDMVVMGDETMPIIVSAAILLNADDRYPTAEMLIMVMLSEDDYDMVDVSREFDRTQFTTQSEFPVTEHSTYIPAEQTEYLYNVMIQAVCVYWDNYLGENLGFGLKGLGFSAYDGYPCSHGYDSVCDALCNFCNEQREAPHNYGAWEKVDDQNHSHQCSICNKTETNPHSWDDVQILQVPSPEEPGVVTFTCICGAQKTEEVPYVVGDLNCDGSMDNRDVEYLLWHTLFAEDYPLYQDTDYTNDGNVNNEDVEYLLWHTLFPEDYPL